MSACPRCPCPDDCRRLPAYCEWAAEEPPDPIKIRHIRDASTHRRAGYPPLATQAAGLAASFWHWATDGFRVVAVEELDRRQAICQACPEFDDGRCRICGCKLAFKLQMKSEHCPLPVPKW